jgi:hypothetical protein
VAGAQFVDQLQESIQSGCQPVEHEHHGGWVGCCQICSSDFVNLSAGHSQAYLGGC